MSGSHGSSRTDPLRKLAIVVLLVAGVTWLYRFRVVAESDFEPTGMLALGFVILGAYAVGELVEVVKLPHITGYLVAGMLLGPSFAEMLPDPMRQGPLEHGFLNADVIPQLKLLDTLALALIALTAGGELKVDELRRGFKQIAGVLGGQVLAVMLGVTAFMWAVTGGVAAISMADLPVLTTPQIVALGACVAALAVATSPSATIAVINGSGAKGPMTRLVLSSVVLKDVIVIVLFSVVSTVAATLLGTSVIEGTLGGYLAMHVGGSLVVGVAVGAGLAAYLAYVNAEVLIFLVGLIYTASYISTSIHLDPVLIFIAAGFTASNFSKEGDNLIHVVERLALPTYVVFFTLAGANLHLDEVLELGPYALGLVLVRAAMYFVGVRAGATLIGAGDNTRRYGWMGFVSQAGVTLALAGMVGKLHPEMGPKLQTLVIAGLAINELIGPVLLSVGLGLSGEAGAGEPHEDEHAEADEPSEEIALAVWQAPEGRGDPWGEPLVVESRELVRSVREIEAELQSIVRDVERGPLEDFRRSAAEHLRTLRREFLRHQRRAHSLVEHEEEPLELAAKLRREESELSESWRSAVLDRAAVLAHDIPEPEALVHALDRMVDLLDETVAAPWEARSFTSRSDEPPYVAVQRVWLRGRARVARMLGGELAPRQVELRKHAAYHFSGLTPERLEAFAAVLVAAESHLADRTRALFDGIIAGYDDLAQRAPTADRDTLTRRLKRLREQTEEEFQLANEELAHIVLDGAMRAATVLGRGLVDLKHDLPVANTLDLPAWQRRFSTVVNSRQRGLDMLTRQFEAGRKTNAAECAVVALELELVGLEGKIKQAVSVHGAQLGRTLQGRGPTQLDRVRAALDECIRTLDELLDGKGAGAELAAKIRDTTDPLAHTTATAASNAQLLRDHLADETALSPLLDELLRASAHLTERYRIPAARPPRGEWKLPPVIGTTGVAFRQIAMAYIESHVTRRLVDLSRELAREATELTSMLEELERVIAFNTELATAELEVLEEGTAEARALAREMLVGALSRSQVRVDEFRESSRAWAERGREGVRAAVLDGLEDLRTEVVGGHARDLGLSLLRDAVSGRRLVDAERLGSNLETATKRARSLLRHTLGHERITALRRTLGLPSSADDLALEPRTFAPPEPRASLPLVYRRLFSDQALEAGDLLTGRSIEIDKARRALHDRAPGRLRSVAVIGIEGAGKGAVITTLTRGFDPDRVRHHHLAGPVGVDTVRGWFDDKSDRVHVITGAGWLFALRPGGLEPLRALASGVVADAGRNAWLLAASLDTWATASRATALDDAFPTVVGVKPFDPQALEAAILARHSMSGYALAFEAGEDLGWQLPLLGRGLDPEQAQRDAWFRTLHAASSGVMQDALLLWMASVLEVDEAKAIIRMGPVPHLPVDALRGLDDVALVTLRLALQQGWITPELYAGAFRVGRAEATAWLAHLRHLGLLDADEDVLRVASHLRAVVHKVLAERRWV